LPIRRHVSRRYFVGARFIKSFDRNLAEVDSGADTRSHEFAVDLQRMKYAAAHGPTTNHSKIYLLHRGGRACRDSMRWTIQFCEDPRSKRAKIQRRSKV